MIKTQNMLPYIGSKLKLIDKLYLIFESIYYDFIYDLCGGSGSVTMNLHKRGCCVINDIKPELAILYMTFSDEKLSDMLIDWFDDWELTQDEFERCRGLWKEFIGNNILYRPMEKELMSLKLENCAKFVELAAAAYVIGLCSYGGVFTNCNTTITDDYIKKSNRYTSAKLLESYKKAFDGVIVYNRNVIEIINDMVKNPDIENAYLLYLDVPYCSSNETDIITSDTYRTHADKEWHLELLELLEQLPTDYYRIIISNHSNDVYDNFISEHLSICYKTFIGTRVNNCANGSICNRKEVVNEYLYSNFKIDI